MKIDSGEKLLYKVRAVAMFQKGDIYIVRREGEADTEHSNPLIAWAQWIESVDVIGRKGIGDYLEKNGRSRWTGEAKEDSKQ